MTDEEFLVLYAALTDANKAILLDMADRLLSEQLERESA